MKSVTVITVTKDDIVKLARSKDLLPEEVIPSVSVASTTGWMSTTQAEVVQLQFTTEETPDASRGRKQS